MTFKKNFRRVITIGGALASASILSGCVSLGVGHEEFSCSGMPDSVYCHSTRDVYEATHDGVVPAPMGGEAYNKECTDCKKSHLDMDGSEVSEGSGNTRTNVQTEHGSDEVIDNYVTVALPERPIPIRTPSQVMRIWVAPFIDTNGDFNSPGYVFTEIEPRRWVLAKERDKVDRMLTPLISPRTQSTVVEVSKEKTPTVKEK